MRRPQCAQSPFSRFAKVSPGFYEVFFDVYKGLCEELVQMFCDKYGPDFRNQFVASCCITVVPVPLLLIAVLMEPAASHERSGWENSGVITTTRRG